MGEQRGLAPLLTVDLAPVTVELNLRESGARLPCKWSSVLEIYSYSAVRAGIGLGCSQDLIIKSGQNGSGINDKIWIGKAVVDAAHLSDIANRNGVSPIAMSPLFYDNVIEHLCKENEKYKSWISSHTSGYYGSVDYYHCSIIETDFDKWIEENT